MYHIDETLVRPGRLDFPLPRSASPCFIKEIQNTESSFFKKQFTRVQTVIVDHYTFMIQIPQTLSFGRDAKNDVHEDSGAY